MNNAEAKRRCQTLESNSCQAGQQMLCAEEPDELVAHVWGCGGQLDNHWPYPETNLGIAWSCGQLIQRDSLRDASYYFLPFVREGIHQVPPKIGCNLPKNIKITP